MSKKRGNRWRSIATLAELFDQVAPDEIDEAREELRSLGVDPSPTARRLEQVALRAMRARILREHSIAAWALIHGRADVYLTNN